MWMLMLTKRLHGFCLEKRTLAENGVRSFFSVRWFVVATLYLLSSAFIGQDPWFGRDQFVYAQGGFVILIGFVVVSTLSFDWCYLGRSRGGNLVLQILLILPMTLMIGRLIGSSSGSQSLIPTNLLGAVKSFLSLICKIIGLSDCLPAPITEIFASPKVAVLFAVICVLLSMGKSKNVRIGLAVSVFVFLVAFSLADVQNRPSCHFVLGMVLAAFGVGLQFHDTSSDVVDRNIVSRLRNVTDEAERRCSIRIMKMACAKGVISLETGKEIIHRCYGDEFGIEIGHVEGDMAPALLRRLVVEHQLLSAVYSNGEWKFRPAEELFVERGAWYAIALVPRAAVVGLIAISWWLMPIDIFPDPVPVVGFVDDFLIMTLGGGVAWRTLKSAFRKRIYLS